MGSENIICHLSVKQAERIHILVVEDEYLNQFIAGKLLQRYGFQYVIAGNGLEAVRLIADKSFQLVLMDMEMPEMDGYETAQIIRSLNDTYFKTVPILLYSSCFFNQNEVINMGMTDIAQKPLEHDDLEQKIIKYVINATI